MPWWLWIASAIVQILYVMLALVLIHLTHPLSIFGSVMYGSAYALFMIVSLTIILNSLPPNISKYFKNKD